jgi:protein involved in polysaccharide export with SLBB domain
MSPAAAVPKTPKASEARVRQHNEVDLTQRYIRISGNVGRPGFYPLGPNTSTLLRAVFAADSELGAVKHPLWEIHRVDGSVEVYRHKAILSGSTNDPSLKPNDHIHVPQKTLVGW